MTVKFIEYLNKIAAFLNVQPGKITVDDDWIPTRTASGNNKGTTVGFLNIVQSFLNETDSALAGRSKLEKAEIRQWIEYATVYAIHDETSTNINQILTEMNGILVTRTYLVSHKLTIADIVLYYFLQRIMENLSIFDKERFINISRWFDNLQQNKAIRQSNKLIDFSTNYLATVAPARH